MQTIALPDDRVEVVGALGSRSRPGHGTTYRRLPSQFDHQLPMEVDQIAGVPSGIRLRFRTDSSMIGLHCSPIVIEFVGNDPYPATIDLVVDGERVDTASTTAGVRVVLDRFDRSKFDITPGDPVTIVLTNAADGERTVEIWLPQAASTEVISLQLSDGATLAAPDPDPRPVWVHYGSSISHCMEAHSPHRTWPATAARIGDVSLRSLGLAGQCHLDQFTARAIRDQPADLISMKVGINVVNGDTMRERAFTPALHGFIDTVREGHPDVPIVLISPIFCPAHETAPGPSIFKPNGKFHSDNDALAISLGALTLTRIRTIESQVVAARRDLGDANLHYLDGLSLFGPDDEDDLPDGLHPNGDGYERMGERFAALAFDGGPFAS